MKKIVLALAMLTLIPACSNKDSVTSEETQSTLMLPKILKSSESYNGTTSTSNGSITYNGNKIQKIINSNNETVYTYTGDVITKEERYVILPTKLKDFEINYSYINNKLKTITKIYYNTDGTVNIAKGENIERNYNSNGDLIEHISTIKYKSLDVIKTNTKKTVFTKNTNGTISFEEYDLTVNPQKVRTGVFTFSNNNLVKIEEKGYGFDNQLQNESVTEKTYDSKNYYGKNILGLNLILEQNRNYGFEYSNNNLISSKTTSKSYFNGSMTSQNTNNYTNIIIYNSDNFPIKIENDKKTSSMEISY